MPLHNLSAQDALGEDGLAGVQEVDQVLEFFRVINLKIMG